jgi:L-ornithine N5-oxygenase
MSPHALSISDATSETPSYTENDTLPTSLGDDLPPVVGESNLQRFDNDDVQDLVCVGFGPAALAIAVALHDSLELKGTRLSTRAPRVRFLEQQSKFAWHAGMLLPGAKMQITFLKDMATLRNPRSEFTFVNYLHEKGRLVQFMNLGTFLPQRIEYEDYMRWCAEHFASVVDYSQTVQNVTVGEVDQKGAAKHFKVTSFNKATGESQTLKAKHVVIAAGGRPNIPKVLSQPHPRIIHSSQYATNVHDIFPDGQGPKTVAVIGGGQSAAEVWHNIPTRFPGAQSLLMIRGSALRPSDDSPLYVSSLLYARSYANKGPV